MRTGLSCHQGDGIGPGMRCHGAVTVGAADEPAVRSRETLRRLAMIDEGFVEDQAEPGIDPAPALDPRTAALLQGVGVGGHRVAGGVPGMERRAGAGGRRE